MNNMKIFHFFISFSLYVVIMSAGSFFEANAQPANDLELYDFQVEYFTNPIGIDDPNPRFSWKIMSDRRNTHQTSYQIQVSESEDFLNVVWDTGEIGSDQSTQIAYDGPELESRKRYYWRVKIQDNHGNEAGWSEASFWEMGLLSSDDWQADWIEPGFEQDSTISPPSPMFRNEFELDKQVESARIYITSHGIYEMEINGERVGDRYFTPGWTSYHNRLQYQVYDITDFLETGENAVGVMLGDGWYRGYLAWGDARNHYGKTLGLLAQIEVTYEDGSVATFGTDDNWMSSTGPILKSDIYNGEMYDARLEKEGWTKTGYDDSDWFGVNVAHHTKENLVAPEGPPVRKIQTLNPIEIFETPGGDTVVDFGQNLVGWVKISAEGKAGTEISLVHAEVLDKEGNFYTANIRAAEQTNRFILKGEGVETFEPHFTFQGFRYVKIEGYPGELSEDDLTAVVLHSDMKPTGHFETSNALLNQLQHNIVWGQKGNFVDIPTDCPQRDERLGWTGDIQVFASTACYNMDASGFLSKWMRDVDADQNEDGSVPYVVPNVLGPQAAGSSGWADASVIVPWTIYQAYGDEQILETQYESMKDWVEYMKTRAAMDSTTYLWDNNFTFGDWLSFNSTASDYPGAYTDKALISTAFFGHSTDLLARSARILGKDMDAQEYEELFENIREAFQHEYMTSSGRIMSNTQTAYLLALQFDLLTEDMESKAVEYLLARVNERGHLTTGFLGTPHLNPILTQYGHTGEAYELLLRKEYPSWLYPVTMGATTIWERWDGIKPDGSFQDPGMNSYNHYAYGAIGEWLYKSVAGIDQETAGYKRISIHPHFGGGLNYVRSFLDSMYGKVESQWHYKDDQMHLIVEIPSNTTTVVTLPFANVNGVRESENVLDQAEEILGFSQSGENVQVEVGSGRYQFVYSSNRLESLLATSEFSTNTELWALMENEEARSILEEHIPELLESESFDIASTMPLVQVAQFTPDIVTADILEAINQELKMIESEFQPRLHVDQKIAELIAYEEGRELLREHLPGLMDSPWLSQVMGYPIEYASHSLPASFGLDSEAINKILNDLKAMSPN
ncbi:alpha-L-rhamnosidase [Rhodohalobacter sp. 614A]|uniref:alpha-L-rhamnosidase n=1 Tax=Rhodohalobacter sp. 614A TaxID=2908649 RepID=UPI001F33BEB5|nr:alpha-L-rhamnosidase [Rhodohalobacter sp. 614A]